MLWLYACFMTTYIDTCAADMVIFSATDFFTFMGVVETRLVSPETHN